MKENEMGRACGTCGRRDMHTVFWQGNFTPRENLEEVDMGGKTKFKRNVQK
jgi:hypothetical protein